MDPKRAWDGARKGERIVKIKAKEDWKFLKLIKIQVTCMVYLG